MDLSKKSKSSENKKKSRPRKFPKSSKKQISNKTKEELKKYLNLKKK